jgi:hypothetical protein
MWILILLVVYNPVFGREGVSSSIESAKFNTKDACYSSLAQAKGLSSDGYSIVGFCQQDSENKEELK